MICCLKPCLLKEIWEVESRHRTVWYCFLFFLSFCYCGCRFVHVLCLTHFASFLYVHFNVDRSRRQNDDLKEEYSRLQESYRELEQLKDRLQNSENFYHLNLTDAQKELDFTKSEVFMGGNTTATSIMIEKPNKTVESWCAVGETNFNIQIDSFLNYDWMLSFEFLDICIYVNKIHHLVGLIWWLWKPSCIANWWPWQSRLIKFCLLCECQRRVARFVTF